MQKIFKLLELFNSSKALIAFFLWPKFSFSSYLIINRLKKLKISPKTVIDVGSNEGQFAVAAAKIFKNIEIFSFEPDKNVIKKLISNLKFHKQSKIINSSIGDYEGNIKFNINKDTQVSSILELGTERKRMFSHAKVQKKILVPIDTLDNFFKKQAFQYPILLKIDVQGYEDKVIKGAVGVLKKINWIIIEISFTDLYKKEVNFNYINNLMKKNGFKFLKPLNFHTSPNNDQIIEMDALFIKKNNL